MSPQKGKFLNSGETATSLIDFTGGAVQLNNILKKNLFLRKFNTEITDLVPLKLNINRRRALNCETLHRGFNVLQNELQHIHISCYKGVKNVQKARNQAVAYANFTMW
jgi:hypothetical protein